MEKVSQANNSTLACWNGEFLPLEDVRVPATDRAFLFGDGVYEVMRVYGGEPFLWDGHWTRLHRSCREIKLACDLEEVKTRVRETLRRSRVQDGMIYLQLSRMSTSRDHAFPNPPLPANQLIYCRSYPTPPGEKEREEGGRAVLRQDFRWHRRDIKSLNLLGNCMVKDEAKQLGCYEAILYEPDGNVTECTSSNVFIVARGRLLTAPEGPHLLSGITRAHVLQIAQAKGVECREVFFQREVLLKAEEVFVTSTTCEVLPIVEVDGKEIGNGAVGPVTRLLQAAFHG